MTDFNFDALNIDIVFVAKTQKDNWGCFQWRIEMKNKNGFQTFDYYTGLAHVEKIAKFHIERGVQPKPKKPSKKDVMYSLLMDADAGNMSFYDFCDHFGYDKDSIKALNIHMDCMQTDQVLRRYFGASDLLKMRESLHDY